MKWNEVLQGLREDYEPRLTKIALSKILHTTRAKISKMEAGETELGVEDLIMLCHFYNVSADYILGFTRERKPCPKE